MKGCTHEHWQVCPLCDGGDRDVRIEEAISEFLTTENPMDSQVGGDHYKKLGEYQPWSVMAKWLTPEELKGYMKGTVCAYLCREEDKGGREDIKKALHTMQIYLEVSE